MPYVIVFPEPEHAELRAMPASDLPTQDSGKVRLRSRLSLLSTGTEGIVYGKRYAPGTHWDRFFSWPHRPGYSMVAEVEDAGDTDLAVGTRVVTQAGHASGHVVDADRCTPVPDAIDDEAAAWFALAKVAFVGAEASGVGLGDSALVVGAGPVGQMAIRWLAAAGVGELSVVDRAGGLRLELAQAGGASTVLGRDLADGLPGSTAPGVVVDSTGNAEAFAHALGVVAAHGRVVVLGDTGFPSEQRLTSDLIVRGITVVGAHGNHVRGERDHQVRRHFFQLVESGRFAMDGLVTHRFAPKDCAEAYQLTEQRRHGSMGIVFDWSAI